MPKSIKLSKYEKVKADVDDAIYILKKKVQKDYRVTWEKARDMVNQSIQDLYEI